MRRYICERCEAQFSDINREGIFLYEFFNGTNTSGIKIDLCPKCQRELEEWFWKKPKPVERQKVKIFVRRKKHNDSQVYGALS